MTRPAKALKILGIKADAPSGEIDAAFERLQRAWEPLTSHSESARRALGMRKVAEIKQAYEAVKGEPPAGSEDDWSEKTGVYFRLPDGSFGNVLDPRQTIQLRPPEELSGLALEQTFAPSPDRQFRRQRTKVWRNMAKLLRGLRFLLLASSMTMGLGMIGIVMLADYLHQANLHTEAVQRAANEKSMWCAHTQPDTAEKKSKAQELAAPIDADGARSQDESPQPSNETVDDPALPH